MIGVLADHSAARKFTILGSLTLGAVHRLGGSFTSTLVLRIPERMCFVGRDVLSTHGIGILRILLI